MDREQINKIYSDYLNDCESERDMEQIFTLAYKAISSAEPQWIPVSEKLPEKDGDYLVTYEKGYAEDYDLGNIGIAGFDEGCLV